MLVIREAQMAAFRADRERRFVEAVEARLVEEQPRQVADLPRALLRARVQEAVSQARAYGFVAQSSAFRFVVLTFAVGPRFDAHPWIQRLLSDPSSTPEARLTALLEGTPESIWIEASALAGSGGPR